MKWIFACCLLAFSSLSATAQELPQALPIVTWDELQARIGGPTLVTLKFNQTPALEAIEALAAQAPVGVQALNRSEWERREPKTLSGDYVAQPFWEVTRDMARKLNAQLINNGYWGTDSGVSFHPYPQKHSALISGSGPAIIALSKADFYRVMPQNAQEKTPSEWLRISGQLYLDPKIHPLDNLILHIDQVRDENGVSLALEGDQESNAKNLPLDLQLNLRPPAQTGGRLTVLSGTLHAAVAFQSETWQVADVMNAQNAETTFRSGEASARVQMRSIQKTDEGYQVVLVISKSRGEKGENRAAQWKVFSTSQQIFVDNKVAERVHLLDDDGRYFLPMGGSTTYGPDAQNPVSTMTINFVAPNNQEMSPARLLVSYDADWRELVVPFGFENLPLP